MTRRDLLILAAARAALAQTENEFIADIVHDYESQGAHRTGTEVDRVSGNWLLDQIRRAGLPAERETWTLNRVDPVIASVTIGNRRIEGFPLLDGGFTDTSGIRGKIGELGSDARIGFTDLVPNQAGAGALGDARRANRHQAIIAVTRGSLPSFCLSNADSFLKPYGPPVMQISSEEAGWLQPGSEATVIAQVKRTEAQSFNVNAKIAGSNPALAPLIIMTPRSGWWTCASERGGGIVCWLMLMRGLQQIKPARDVLFTATSGHEIGYLGIEQFVAKRPGIVKQAHAWIHFGANVGAAQEPGNTIQASDDAMESLEAAALTRARLHIDRRVPRGSVPGGEAGVIHRGGGRYMSIIGRNALFHSPLDRGPEAIDANAIGRFAAAFSSIATQLAGSRGIA